MTTNPIIDLNAGAFGRVAKFTAKSTDSRYYLAGVHIRPMAESGGCLEGTDGHRLYVEEDTSGRAMEEKILRFSPAAQRLLKKSNRVQLSEDGELSICDGKSGKKLYIQPDGVIDYNKFPDVCALIGDRAQWRFGLSGAVNADYLRAALALPGCIAFWRKGDNAADSDMILFTISSAGELGANGWGAIMPMRASFGTTSQLARHLPLAYREQPVADGAAPAAPATQSASEAEAQAA